MKRRFSMMVLLFYALSLALPQAAMADPVLAVAALDQSESKPAGTDWSDLKALQFKVGTDVTLYFNYTSSDSTSSGGWEDPGVAASAATEEDYDDSGLEIRKSDTSPVSFDLSGTLKSVDVYEIKLIASDDGAGGDDDLAASVDIIITVTQATPSVSEDLSGVVYTYDQGAASPGTLIVSGEIKGGWFWNAEAGEAKDVKGQLHAKIASGDEFITQTPASEVKANQNLEFTFTATELAKLGLGDHAVILSFDADGQNAEISNGNFGKITVVNWGDATIKRVRNMEIQKANDSKDGDSATNAISADVTVTGGTTLNATEITIDTDAKAKFYATSEFNETGTDTTTLGSGIKTIVYVKTTSKNEAKTLFYALTVTHQVPVTPPPPSNPPTPSTPTDDGKLDNPATEELPGDSGATVDLPKGTEVNKDDGSIVLPSNDVATVHEPGGIDIELPPSTTIGSDGKITLPSEGSDATVTTAGGSTIKLQPGTEIAGGAVAIPSGKTATLTTAGRTVITLPAATSLNIDGSATVANGATAAMKTAANSTVELPAATKISAAGAITLPNVKATATTAAGSKIELPAASVIAPDGAVSLPGEAGTTMTTGTAVIALPAKTEINIDGAIALPDDAETKLSVPSGVTIPLPAATTIQPDGTVALPDEAGTTLTTAEASTVALPAGTSITAGGAVTLPEEKASELTAANDSTLALPGGTRIAPNGAVTLPESKPADVTTETGATMTLPAATTIQSDGSLTPPDGGLRVRTSNASGASATIKSGTVQAWSGDSKDRGNFLLNLVEIVLEKATIKLSGKGSLSQVSPASARMAASAGASAETDAYLLLDATDGATITNEGETTPVTVEKGAKVRLNADGAATVEGSATGGGSGGCAAGSFGLLVLALAPLMRRRTR